MKSLRPCMSEGFKACWQANFARPSPNSLKRGVCDSLTETMWIFLVLDTFWQISAFLDPQQTMSWPMHTEMNFRLPFSVYTPGLVDDCLVSTLANTFPAPL
eukprot:4933279-Alexandrium_andersonii.AAC.1